MGKHAVKTYVITAAQAVGDYDSVGRYTKGAPNRNFISSLENYCEKNNGELVIISMAGKDAREKELHEFFDDRDDVYDVKGASRRLNTNIHISDMYIPPQNVDPASGRDRFVQRETSLIVAHPKQRLKTIPASNYNFPKLFASTGACTYPNYNDMNHRGDAASRDHTFGAAIVEIIDDTCFNLRQVSAVPSTGKIIDMGMAYEGSKAPRKAGVEALVLGDIHWGDHDPETIKANYEMINFFSPKRLFLHDFLNGHSVNPHEMENTIMRAREFKAGRLSIEKELKEGYEELCNLSDAIKGGKVYVVASNHPFFFERYLEKGRYLNEPWNLEIAMRLGAELAKKDGSIEAAGLGLMGKIPNNVHFLELTDDLKVEGWQLASHGHKGSSGARGSVRSREIGSGKSITGHTHAPEILRKTIIVGTSTKLQLPYTNGGSSSWLAANAVLYEGGIPELIPIINGKWKGNRK